MNPINSTSSPGPNRSPALTETVAPGFSITDREATRQAREQHVGQRPGTLSIREGALKPRLFLVSYDDANFTEAEFTDRYNELLHHVR